MHEDILSEVIQHFAFDFDDITPERELGGVSLYGIRERPGLFIVDAPEGRRLATDPSIVGEEFDSLNRTLSRKAWRLIEDMNVVGEDIIFEHVLRAAPGYRLREAIEERSSFKVTDFYIRPRYIQTSYRQHSQNYVENVFTGELHLNESKTYTLVKPDTEATGRSSIAAIDAVVEKCRSVGASIDKVVLYGFISMSGYRRILDFANQRNLDVVALAVEDVTALASNGYDMPVYGIDEGARNNKGSMVRLASMIPERVLEGILTEYYPGMDQPGDWSERQSELFNGISVEKGDILSHLNRSLTRLNALRSINSGEPWYSQQLDEVYQKNSERLLDSMRNQSGGDLLRQLD